MGWFGNIKSKVTEKTVNAHQRMASMIIHILEKLEDGEEEKDSCGNLTHYFSSLEYLEPTIFLEKKYKKHWNF